jgi:hypothetical protein
MFSSIAQIFLITLKKIFTNNIIVQNKKLNSECAVVQFIIKKNHKKKKYIRIHYNLFKYLIVLLHNIHHHFNYFMLYMSDL